MEFIVDFVSIQLCDQVGLDGSQTAEIIRADDIDFIEFLFFDDLICILLSYYSFYMRCIELYLW